MGADSGGLGPRIDVTLDGKTYDLKPTFGALVRIEQTLGVGIGALLQRFLRGEFGLTDITRIVYEGIVAGSGNDAPEFEAVGVSIVREGVEAVAPAALDMLTSALRGLEKFAADKAEDAEQTVEAADDENPTPPPEPASAAESPGAGSSASPS